MGLDRVFEILDIEPDVVNALDAVPMPSAANEIRFDGVAFAYQADRPVLRSASFAARAGEITAIVGPTGSGKSTLMALLTRLFDPDAGSIAIDGIDLRRIDVESLRRNVAIALQENVLFALSVRDNLRYAAPDATDDQIRQAAYVSCVDDYVASLPDGLDTVLGDRGGKLSTGQRQRLSIARAIAKDARILILDEPTAALDAATEHQVLERLDNWARGYRRAASPGDLPHHPSNLDHPAGASDSLPRAGSHRGTGRSRRTDGNPGRPVSPIRRNGGGALREDRDGVATHGRGDSHTRFPARSGAAARRGRQSAGRPHGHRPQGDPSARGARHVLHPLLLGALHGEVPPDVAVPVVAAHPALAAEDRHRQRGAGDTHRPGSLPGLFRAVRAVPRRHGACRDDVLGCRPGRGAGDRVRRFRNRNGFHRGGPRARSRHGHPDRERGERRVQQVRGHRRVRGIPIAAAPQPGLEPPTPVATVRADTGPADAGAERPANRRQPVPGDVRHAGADQRLLPDHHVARAGDHHRLRHPAGDVVQLRRCA